MENLRCFIKIGNDRINANEIISYGLDTDWDEDDEEYRFLYVQTQTSDEIFQYDEDDVDFDLDEKIAELDDIFLIRKLGHVDFERQ